ncbi:MAG: phosphatase PAP2 family protein [Pseudomonadota bacterium]
MDFLHNMNWVLPLRSDTATIVANAFTWLGYTLFFLMALPLTYWLWDRTKAMRLVVIIAISAVLNGWLKDLWQDPRPPRKIWLDQRVEGSYGRPSGHAQVAFAMWMWIAYELKRPWAWPAAIFIVAGVCLSRLYLGVHDIDDILTGLSLGAISILIFVWMQSSIFDSIRTLPTVVHLGIVVIVGVILFMSWPNGHHADQTVGALVLLAGWLVGADIDHRLAPEAPVLPAWWGRIIIGVSGIVMLFVFRKLVTEAVALTGLTGTVAEYIVTFATSFYMTGLAPIGFRAVNLMK